VGPNISGNPKTKNKAQERLRKRVVEEAFSFEIDERPAMNLGTESLGACLQTPLKTGGDECGLASDNDLECGLLKKG